MSSPAPTGPADLTQGVRRALGNRAFLDAIEEVYRRVDAVVAAEQFVCLGGGACCRFDLASHRLFVSTGELALLTLDAPPCPENLPLGRCPYQVGPRCRARRRRPLGCRAHFCRDAASRSGPRLYESAHAEIRRLHERQGIPYVYLDMLEGMGTLVGLQALVDDAPTAD